MYRSVFCQKIEIFLEKSANNCETASYSGRTLLLYMTFVLINMTSKHFWLLQCTQHQTRITYPWCIANCSHWNWNSLLFYRSMVELSSQRFYDHIQWFQWLQLAICHGDVTLVWCHMHWSSQKCIEVMIIITNVMHKSSMRSLYEHK